MKLFNKKQYNRKKKKYALMSTAVTALFIAAVILFNIGFLAIANHFYWYLDLSKGEIYSLCDATKELLSDVDKDVDIYFTVEADKVASTNDYLNTVYKTALKMQSAFDFIHVKCVDIVENPSFFRDYYNTAATDIYTTSVIVASGTEFRLFAIDAFFITNDDGKIWAYQGEYKLVSAILSMTQSDMPVVAFTGSHGETVGAEASAIMSLFADGGFEVVTVDLAKEDLPDDTRIVVINNPVFDFAGIEAGDSNEIAKLDSFLDTYGTLMVFTSPENAGKLTNLSELLDEWGIKFNPDTHIVDTGNSMSVDGTEVVAQYEKDTLGASLYLDLTALDTMPKTIMRDCMPLTLLYEGNSEYEGSKDVSAILTAHDTARKVCGDSNTSANGDCLMAVSRESRIINNDYYYSYVLVSGCSDFLANKYIKSDAYANSDIIYSTMRITGRDRVLADIDIKVLDNTTMTITTAQANAWMVCLVTIIPAIAAVCGIVVLVRRRNS